ncbi:MAG: hypothetical protein ACSHX8_05145 [Opitutaceae bacterium]
MKFEKGDFIDFDGLLGVVVDTDESESVPEGHLTVWYGEPKTERISEGGEGNATPIVYNVPEEYCNPAATPRFILH